MPKDGENALVSVVFVAVPLCRMCAPLWCVRQLERRSQQTQQHLLSSVQVSCGDGRG